MAFDYMVNQAVADVETDWEKFILFSIKLTQISYLEVEREC